VKSGMHVGKGIREEGREKMGAGANLLKRG
jgi:hypothetical protein